MPITFDKQLEKMIETLKLWHSWLLEHGQSESAHFVSLTRLELQLVRNNISDEELRALCDTLAQAKVNKQVIPGHCMTGAERLGKAESKRIMQLAVAHGGQNRKH